MNDDHHSSRTPAGGSSSTVLLLTTMLLPVLYTLSIGPIVMLENRGWLGPEEGPLYRSLAVFYLPLDWCVMQGVPFLTPAVLWYASLWKSLG